MTRWRSPGNGLGVPQRQAPCRASKLSWLPECAPKAEPFVSLCTALGSGLPFAIKASWGQVLTQSIGVSLEKALGADWRRDQPLIQKGFTWLKAHYHSSQVLLSHRFCFFPSWGGRRQHLLLVVENNTAHAFSGTALAILEPLAHADSMLFQWRRCWKIWRLVIFLRFYLAKQGFHSFWTALLLGRKKNPNLLISSPANSLH